MKNMSLAVPREEYRNNIEGRIETATFSSFYKLQPLRKAKNTWTSKTGEGNILSSTQLETIFIIVRFVGEIVAVGVLIRGLRQSFVR